jgi:hypothetical protein
VDELNRAITAEIFKHKSWIQFYYIWAGFKNYNLVVRVNIAVHIKVLTALSALLHIYKLTPGVDSLVADCCKTFFNRNRLLFTLGTKRKPEFVQ